MNKEFVSQKVRVLLPIIKCKKVVLWGAGAYGNFLVDVLEEFNINIEKVIDSNKIGGTYKGLLIESPEILKNNHEEYFVFVATQHFQIQIKTDLEIYGYKMEHQNYMYFCKYRKNEAEKIENYRDDMNNRIEGIANHHKSRVVFEGYNNLVELEEDVVLENCFIRFFGNNGYLRIGKSSLYRGMIFIGSDCKVVLGKRLTVTSNCFISVAENSELTVGNDCMFATNNQIRTHDGHPIFDVNTGVRLNKSKNIYVGNHVWLAHTATLLSGARIGEGSVIGHSAIVKSQIPNNCIAAGVPAKVIKQNISWDRSNLQSTFPYSFPDSNYILDKKYWNLTNQ